MFRFLRKPARKSARRLHNSHRTMRPLVERLEDRRVLAAGDLDLTWDGDGVVQTNLSQNDGAHALAIQADGKVVAGGWYSPKSGNQDFALIRYNIDGSQDSTFGTGGVVTTSFTSKSDVIHAAVVQADGKIVVGGFATSGNSRVFALARYNANGTLDGSFGSGGKVTTNISSGQEWITELAIQPDGKIVAAGRAEVNGTVGVARYNANGTLDSSFGSGGKVVFSWVDGGTACRGLLVQPDGRIVVGGNSIARLNPNGSFDQTFGDAGQSKILSVVGRMDFQNGQIIASGETIEFIEPNIDDALVRLNADGSQDLTFGNAGFAPLLIDFGLGLAVQADGRILVGGQQFNTLINDHGLAAMRFNADGSPDSAFGTDGLAIASQPGVVVTRLALAPDGKIVVTGYGGNMPTGDFYTARFEGDPPAAPAAGAGASDSDIALMLFLAAENTIRRRRT